MTEKPLKIISPCYKCEEIKCNSNECKKYNTYHQDTISKKDFAIEIEGEANRLDKLSADGNYTMAVRNKEKI